MSYSPGRAVGWIRERAEHVAQQLGAPYDGAMRAWLDEVAEHRWAVDGLAAGIPFILRAVDAEGCTYALTARPDVEPRTETHTEGRTATASHHGIPAESESGPERSPLSPLTRT
ncbi:hypothetical protein [Streptomyces halobius]|uniref:Uncharacterized protein n=1 Tax=Streptomyces halobius TaxID=2879846 RepID=A0ABY4M718_9ACTN|nr:hypothetical protein [Streptomyces halobius]UQA93575.1 hypothetical protein K9S39_18490 [Streptomyces halobius]